MAAPANVDLVGVSAEISMKIKKVKCKTGQIISKGTVVCLYSTKDDAIQRLKSCYGGVIRDISAKEGDDLKSGSPLYKVEVCNHPTVMKDMCADCGSDLRLENATAGNRKEQVSASVAMIHSIPELIVSEQLAKELGKADENRLLKTRKLVLLVDLDQTLIHTTNDNIPVNLKDVHHFQLWHGNQLLWYHTRLRPYTQNFLESVSKLYELHICTFGARMYAHTIAKILDPEGKYFSHRILSRDECFNASTKTANLKALFPCGESMVCIIDDREDVWNFAPNLIHVKPYRFFQGTADINAPPGLTKTEQDRDPIVHRIRRVSQSSTNSTDSNDNDKNENTKFPTEEEMRSAEKKRLKSVNENEMEVEESKEVTAPDQESEIKSGTLGEGDAKSEDKKTDDCGEKENEETKTTDNSAKASENGEKKDSGNANEEEKENVPDKEKETQMEKENKSEKSDEQSKSDWQTGSQEQKKTDENKESKEEELIVWEDEDDYLFYLKEILETIHATFYDMIDQLKEKDEQPKETDKPNLKNIIPYMKKKVLKGCNILFSGVIPTNMAHEKSRAYIVAKALGASVHKDMVTKENEKDSKNFTTHVVAARHGTSKVRLALKCKSVFIVNADWLWSCAERWEKVEEDLFPLAKASDERNCDSPDVSEMTRKKDGKRKLQSDETTDRKEKKAKTESENDSEKVFSHSYNPLFAFSDDDLAYMDKEVDDEMDSEGNDSSEEDEDREKRLREKVLKEESGNDSSSQDSLSGNRPRGWGLNRKLSPKSSSSEDEMVKSPAKNSSSRDELGPEYESETDQDKFEKIMDAFGHDTENSDDEEYQESVGSVDDELADAVEKEFLS